MNLAITPRVTYEGEIVLDLSVENNAIGAPVDVGGQSALSFTSRKVHTCLRLREGESNLLAGLIKQDNTTDPQRRRRARPAFRACSSCSRATKSTTPTPTS